MRRVLICQSRACCKGGAAKVLAAFQAEPVRDVAIEPSGCLGQCGNGPMVLILPEQSWYCRLQPQEVPVVIQKHLRNWQPVQPFLYPKFHRQST